MRVLMVGLGDIAQKAYLPVLGTLADIDLHLCTRDVAKLADLGRRLRVSGLHADLDAALRAATFDAAFVHASTAAHSIIVEQLLLRGIPTFVDKPLADTLEQAERLITRAERAKVPLFVGFNRRYAPGYANLANRPRSLIMMEKHRRPPMHPIRRTIFDDFIHVVDTLRFLAPVPVVVAATDLVLEGTLLRSIMLVLTGAGFQASGTMSRDAGLSIERLTVIGEGASATVHNLADLVEEEGRARVTRRGDWTSVPHQRGFEAMIEAFIEAARGREPLDLSDVLETHRVCEMLVMSAQRRH